eukprot:jgi/Chrpa1/14104/Chrysochromulina_OHIO_Genome00020455-RA
MLSVYACLLLTLPLCSGRTLGVHRGGLLACRAPRATRVPSRLRCCAVDPPPDLDTVCEEARQCLREALLGGKRGLTVEASMQALDVTSRAYDPPVLARFSLEVSKALTVVPGTVLLLLPGMAAVTAARELIDNEAVWPEEDRARISVSSLALQGGPKKGEPLPAAVVLVGLTSVKSADDPSVRDARAWLRASAYSVVINSQLKMAPVEMAAFEAAYCLLTYTVARSERARADGERYAADLGTAALVRRYPQSWRVLLDVTNTRDWSEVAELPRRPLLEDLNRLVLPRVQEHQASLEAAAAALGASGNGVAGNGVAAVKGGKGSGAAAGGAAGGGAESSSSGVAAANACQDARGVVSLTWAAIEAPGALGPTALYGAIALHRMRTLGKRARLEREEDARGMHLVLPAILSDGASAWDPSVKKVRGSLLLTCQLVLDGAAEGIAALKQLALAAEAREEQVAAVLVRAIDEARKAGQVALLVTPPEEEPNGILSTALLGLGFDVTASGPGPLASALATAPAGTLGVAIMREAPEEASVEAPPLTAAAADEATDAAADAAAADEPMDAEALRAALEEQTKEMRPAPDEELRIELLPEETMPGATEDDVARLKRMFGGGLSSN